MEQLAVVHIGDTIALGTDTCAARAQTTSICEEAACGREGLPPYGPACATAPPPFALPDSGCLPGHHLREGACTACGMTIPDSAEGFSRGIVKCDDVGCEYTIQFQIEFHGAYSHLLEAGQIPSVCPPAHHPA